MMPIHLEEMGWVKGCSNQDLPWPWAEMHTSQLKTLNHKYADDELVLVFVMDNFEDDDDNQIEKNRYCSQKL
jgi:hypothetical protein